ncbi:polysaccharide biosynthesis protein [Hoylesella timonensis]|uniref:Polysaccharide biosynthesis protein n=1 Tax=Hoylesella timonensis TaxID=386414 RepID=A0A2K0XI03_9BACT|nr:lipopolysaccharide biosynthesis protein [Hoylesella timonensis]PNP94162.1 polysaccharide biosynthesis protein [Hoylesella timonensis]
MSNLKSLVKDTAIYGLSSIVGRFLNYLLTPLYTIKLASASGEYGIMTNMYAITALILVILTFGLETTFFRFANKSGENANRVYSSTLITVGAGALGFFLLVLLFLSPIASFMGYAQHPSYIWVMALTVAIDSFLCIPFDYLRFKSRPIKFASIKVFIIVLNISLNLVYYLLFPALYASHPELMSHIYQPSVGVGYAFYINLACSALTIPLLWKELTSVPYHFDAALMRRMLSYSWPILVLGLAGILNQTADKILFPHIYKGDDSLMQLGIYGAASKIAMIMAMITQAFRFAYEPFVFGKSEEQDNRATYAKAMKYFIIFTLLAFLVVVGYLDVLRYLIGKDYWAGLQVVPIVMAAEMMMGVYFNLSFWYKLIDKTIWGAYFSGIGCAVLIAINIIFVPRYGYIACAWAGFTGYGVAMILSYVVGQRKYPINYPMKSIFKYVALAVVCFAAMTVFNQMLLSAAALGVNTLLILLFVSYIVKMDFPLYQLPVIGKYFKKSTK